jgi:hypothetical protein
MKLKIKYYVGTMINWFKSIKIWADDKPIGERYWTMYFMYIGEQTIETYSKIGKIAYCGETSKAPFIFHFVIEKDDSIKKDKYVIIFDNWNK